MDFPAQPPDAFAGTSVDPNQRSALPVLIATAVSTALAVLAQHALMARGINVIGFHVNYILPLGAVLVGLVASLGGGIVAYNGGHRVTGRLLFAVSALLLAGYGASQYLTFRSAFPEGGGPGFIDWYEFSARSIRFSGKRGAGGALGGWGLAVRALQAAGFVLGGLIAPLILRSLPYCARCGRYRKTKELAVVGAGIPDKMFGNDAPERVEQRKQLLEAAQAARAEVFAAAAKADGPGAAALLDRHGPRARSKEAHAGNARIVFELAHCPGCGEGELKATLVTGQGKQIKREQLQAQSVTPPVAESLLMRGS